MFTGIVEGVGTIKSLKRRNMNASLEVEVSFDLEDTTVGDSLAIDGCCLTVTSRLGNRFWADISGETMRVTTLGRLEVGTKVNAERALKMGGRLGGHLVQGHVDGVGKIVSFQDVESGKELSVQIPGRLERYIVEKGSITVDGISLTINKVAEQVVSIRVVPHTLDSTTLSSRKVGDGVNLEVDIIGKYVEKLRFLEAEEFHKESKITEEFLKKHGF